MRRVLLRLLLARLFYLPLLCARLRLMRRVLLCLLLACLRYLLLLRLGLGLVRCVLLRLLLARLLGLLLRLMRGILLRLLLARLIYILLLHIDPIGHRRRRTIVTPCAPVIERLCGLPARPANRPGLAQHGRRDKRATRPAGSAAPATVHARHPALRAPPPNWRH